MPRGPQNHKGGKYANYNLQYQGFEINKMYMGFVADFLTDEETIKDSANFMTFVSKQKRVSGVQEKDKNGQPFDFTTSASPQEEQAFLDSSKRIKTKIDNLRESKDPKDEKYKRFNGYLKLLSTVFDTEAGRYTEALRDNPVIRPMYSMSTNALATNRHGGLDKVLDKLSDQTDPETGKKAPLCYMDEYFSNVADLIHLEYMRQDLMESHDPAAEKDYVDKLKTCYRKTLDNYDKFHEFVKNNMNEKGETKYDQYMNNPLDMYTGIHHSQTHSQRSASRQMAFIRGELAALENGWGIEEARLAGLVSKEEFSINRELEVDEKRNAKEQLRVKIKDKENEIAKYNKLLKTEKKADRKASIKSQINTAQVSIKEYQEQLDAYDEYHDRFKKYANSLKKLNEDISKTNNPTTEQKREFLNRYQSIRKNLDKEKYYSKDESEHLKDARQNILFKGRKIMQENSAEFTAEEITSYENYYLVKELNQHLSTYLMHKNHELYENIYHEDPKIKYAKNDPDFDTLVDQYQRIPMDERKKGPLPKSGDSVQIDYNFDKDGNKKFTAWVDKFHQSLEERLSNPAEEDIAFIPYMRVFSTMADRSKGSFFRIIAEKPYASRLYQSIASGPSLDIGSNAELRDNLQKSGVLRPVVGLYDGLNDFINAEYYKQGAEKTGQMSKAEEQNYLKLYDDACAKVIKNFDELDKLPPELQNKKVQGLGNSIDNFTARGLDAGVGRQIRTVVSGLRWQREAIRNGWGSDNLDLAAVLGNIEGNLEVKTLYYEEKIKAEKAKKVPNTKDIGDYEKNLKELNDFKAEKFDHFKESIIGKKITSPSDMLDILNKIDDFKERNQNAPAVSKNGLFSELEIAEDLIAGVNNRCIKDIKDLQSGKKKLENIMPRPFKGSEYVPDRSKGFIKELVNTVNNSDAPFSQDMANFMLVSFVENKLLSGIDKNTHPELFDGNHPLYKITRTELHDQAAQYSESLTKKLFGNSETIAPGKLADIMQYGNFDNDLSFIKDRLKATQADNKATLFLNGSIQNGTKTESINNGLKNAIKGLDKASTFNLFVNEYDSILNSSQKLLKQKLEFDKKLRTQMETAEASPNGKDVKLDKEKFNKFRHELNINISRINKYIAEKDKIRNANPDLPENEKAKLLGTKREKKYQAMKKALNVMKHLQTISREFKGEGPTAENYRTLKKPSIVDIASLNNDAAHARSHFEKAIDTANAGISQILTKEESARAKLDPAKGTEPYREALLTSAKKTLYLSTIKDCLGSKEQQYISTLESNSKKYNAAIKDYAQNEANSEQFKKFEEECFKNPAFKKQFTDELVNAAKTNKELPLETINNVRDKALDNCVKQASQNTIELEEISKIAKGLGSKVADQIKAMKNATKENLNPENAQLKNPVLENKKHRLPTHNMGPMGP